MTRLTAASLAFAGALALSLSACAADQGGQVRTVGSSASAGSASGTGSGSGSGLSASKLQAGSDNPLVQEAVKQYKVYVIEQVDSAVALTKKFTDAVRAGDLKAAQAAYAPSRVPWERIEPIAGLVEVIDGKVDARVDDFENENDPEFTGWHRLEYLIFDKETTKGAAKFADQLDADLQTLKKEMATLEIPAAAVPVGASELIEEVSLGKITGEEDRYSKTDLWDFWANVEGSQKAVELLAPALEQANPALLADLRARFAKLATTLEPLRDGNGWVLYCLKNDDYPSPRCPEVTVPPATVQSLKAQLAGLSEKTSQIAGVLKLQ